MDLSQCSDKGLTTDEWKHRLEQYGPNKLPESKRIPLLVFLGYMWNPLSWAMECAAIASIALLDYVDFVLILSLLLCNASIRYALACSIPRALLHRHPTPSLLADELHAAMQLCGGVQC